MSCMHEMDVEVDVNVDIDVDVDVDVYSYLKLDGLQNGGGYEKEGEEVVWRSLNLSDSEEECSFDCDFDIELELGMDWSGDGDADGADRKMPSMIHTQPVHLIQVHNLKCLQTQYEDAVSTPASKPLSLANTRHSSVFSSTKSINVLLQEERMDEMEHLELMEQSSKPLAAPIMLPALSASHHVIKSDPRLFASQTHTEDDLFVYTLTNKLMPYFGYFLADSNDLDYFDKIRFQEIDYKLSKTYF